MTYPWTNVAGHLGEDEGLFLHDLAKGKRVLEIGTHHGRSTSALASSALSVVTIDTYLGDPQIRPPNLTVTKDGLKNFTNITLLIGDWRDQDFDYSEFDMIFYDGCHTEEGHFLSTLVSFPGIIALHDYKLWDPGMKHVVESVDAFAELTNRPRLLTVGSVAWFDAL